jgi:glycosyltransferase involved in cell wall biosynthesis
MRKIRNREIVSLSDFIDWVFERLRNINLFEFIRHLFGLRKTEKYLIINKTRPVIIAIALPAYYNVSIRSFLRLLKKYNVTFIYFFAWTPRDKSAIRNLVRFYSKFKRRYRNHRLIYACNDPIEKEILDKSGLPHILCNNNVFCDEHVFKVIPDSQLKYDAVYNAAFLHYKRHFLASKLPNVAFVSRTNEGFERVRKLVPQATFLNYTQYGWKRFTFEENVGILNSARVGLCLSAVEGSMYASIEYLLCGLPIVSTKSIGGRDAFFDSDYVLIVNDDPLSVLKGVNEMIKRDIPRDHVRNKTIEKMLPHRENLIKYVQSVYDAEGINKDFRHEFMNMKDRMSLGNYKDLSLIVKSISCNN